MPNDFDHGDRKQERRGKSYAPFHSSFFLEKAQRPARIDSEQFWTEKSQVWDSNPASSDRMPLLYRLRYHRGQQSNVLTSWGV